MIESHKNPVRGRPSFSISNLSSQVPLFPAISIFCCWNFHSFVGTFTHLLQHSLSHCNFYFPWNFHSFTATFAATFRVSINTTIFLPLSHRSSMTSRSPATKPAGAAQLLLHFVSTLSVHNNPIWSENDVVWRMTPNSFKALYGSRISFLNFLFDEKTKLSG